MKFCILSIAVLFLYSICFCSAQVLRSQPVPRDVINEFSYLVVTSASFKEANLVDTERVLPEGKQQLAILNINVPLAKISSEKFSMDAGLLAASTMLITFAIMPDKDDKQVHWKPIKLDTLSTSRRTTSAAFIDTCYLRLARYHRKSGQLMQDNDITRSASIKPVIYRAGQYWTTSNYTLTEIFLVCPLSFILPFQGDNVTISTLYRPYSLAEVEKEWNLERVFHFERSVSLGEILSSKIILRNKINEDLYEFHTFGPNTIDASDFYTGAEDFIYKKGIGLISGRYERYVIPCSAQVGPLFVTKRITCLE